MTILNSFRWHRGIRVMVDSFMLEMDGREVAVEIKRLKPQVTITMLSGAVDVPEAVLDWVDAFLAKDRVAGQLLPAMAQLQAAPGSSQEW